METGRLNLLFVAYHFPPDGSSGSFRSLHFANHLQKLGVHVHALTARVESYMKDQPIDMKLLESVDEFIRIVRTPVSRPRETLLSLRNQLNNGKPPACRSPVAVDPPEGPHRKPVSKIREFKNVLTDCLALPDHHVGWLPWAVAAGLRMIRRDKIDAIYASGGPWTCFLVGAMLKTLTGLPLVTDFRDPWAANPVFLGKTNIVRCFATIMERQVVKAADLIIANTPELGQDFVARYPNLPEGMVTVIPNGFENYNFDTRPAKASQLTLLHAGDIYGARSPKNLLKAALGLVRKGKIPKDGLRIIFLGELSAGDRDSQHVLQDPIIKEIVEISPRVPYHEAIEQQKASDVLVLIQPGFPLQVPRKLYDYMAFNKPILAVTDPLGATSRLMEEADLGIVARNTAESIESSLELLYGQWKKGTLNHRNRGDLDFFLNKNLSLTLYHAFANLAYRRHA